MNNDRAIVVAVAFLLLKKYRRIRTLLFPNLTYPVDLGKG